MDSKNNSKQPLSTVFAGFGTFLILMNGLTICMFTRYGSGGEPALPVGMCDSPLPGGICDRNHIGKYEDGFWNRQFFLYFVGIGYFVVLAIQTLGTMFGDRNQIECVVSNIIGFFLYIAAGSMVVWSYNFELDEDGDYREGVKKRGLALGWLMILQGLIMAIDSVFRIPKIKKQVGLSKKGR